MSWLQYLVEANIYLCLFYLFYCLFLTRETYYTLNRAYLLFSCVASLLIPVVQIGWLKPVVGVNPIVPTETITDSAFTIIYAALSAYFIGVTVAFVLLAVKLYKLNKLARQNPSFIKDSYKLIFLEESTTAFSFFNYLFIGTETLEPELITSHELVHIRQKHSVDIILLELFKIVNWFNPVVYLLQNSLKTLHEYIADEQTAKTDMLSYATFLVNNAYGISGSTITHSFFNYNLLKKRIIMLNQQRSGNLARLKYLVALPICAGLLCASTLAFSKSYGFIGITQQKQVPPPPPPAPPVSKDNHKAPPPPPAPPATNKISSSKTVVDQVKLPPSGVRAHKSISSKKVVDQVKFPPPVVKPDNDKQ